MKRLILGVMVLGVVCSAALGGGLKTEQVSGSAVWVAHLDCEAVLGSQIGKFILSEIRKAEPNLDAKLAGIKQIVGVDPLEDVRGITLYSEQLVENSGVVVVDWTADHDKIMTLLKMNDSYKEHKYGDHLIVEWVDKGKGEKPDKRQFGCLYDKTTGVISQHIDEVKAAIDVLAGKADSLAKTGALAAATKTDEGVFVVVAAEGFDLPDKDDPGAAMLKNISGLTFQLGEADGSVYMNLAVTTKVEQDATYIRQMVQGMVAFVQILKRHDDLRWARDLGETITVSGRGTTARLDVTIAVDSLKRVFEHLAEIDRREKAAKAAKE